MGILVDVLRDARVLAARARSKTRAVRYRDADITRQQISLRSYVSGIVDVATASPTSSTDFAVFVHHAPGQAVSPSTLRALGALRSPNVNVIFVANHELSDADRAPVGGFSHSILVRNNQGYDFGAYKDAMAWLRDCSHQVERLVLINDSVFFGGVGLVDMFSSMLGPEGVIAAHENWGEDHHLQSFLLSMSRRVINDPAVCAFWDEYVPVDNRIHAIEAGEKELSRALLSAAWSTRVVYSASRLYTALLDGDLDLESRLIIYPNPWRSWIEALDTQEVSREFLVNKIVDIVNVTSTVHAGAYLFPKVLGSPIYKKDLVYRQRFDFWEVDTWISEVLDEAEAAELLTCLRKKRDASSLSTTDRRKFDIGVR